MNESYFNLSYSLSLLFSLSLFLPFLPFPYLLLFFIFFLVHYCLQSFLSSSNNDRVYTYIYRDIYVIRLSCPNSISKSYVFGPEDVLTLNKIYEIISLFYVKYSRKIYKMQARHKIPYIYVISCDLIQWVSNKRLYWESLWIFNYFKSLREALNWSAIALHCFFSFGSN